MMIAVGGNATELRAMFSLPQEAPEDPVELALWEKLMEILRKLEEAAKDLHC